MEEIRVYSLLEISDPPVYSYSTFKLIEFEGEHVLLDTWHGEDKMYRHVVAETHLEGKDAVDELLSVIEGYIKIDRPSNSRRVEERTALRWLQQIAPEQYADKTLESFTLSQLYE